MPAEYQRAKKAKLFSVQCSEYSIAARAPAAKPEMAPVRAGLVGAMSRSVHSKAANTGRATKAMLKAHTCQLVPKAKALRCAAGACKSWFIPCTPMDNIAKPIAQAALPIGRPGCARLYTKAALKTASANSHTIFKLKTEVLANSLSLGFKPMENTITPHTARASAKRPPTCREAGRRAGPASCAKKAINSSVFMVSLSIGWPRPLSRGAHSLSRPLRFVRSRSRSR